MTRTEIAKEKYEGKIFKTKDGREEFRVNKFNSGSDIEIEFLNCGFIRHVSSYDLGKGINSLFKNDSQVLYTFDNKKFYEGCYYKTNQGYTIQIIQYNSVSNIVVKFVNVRVRYETVTTLQNIQKGQVRYPYHPNQFGGYLGVGIYNGDNYDWLYNIWHNILVRATDGRSKFYSKSYRHSAQYHNITLDDSWYNYNTFAEWYMRQLSGLNSNYSYDVDKDCLFWKYKSVTNNKKIYGPQFCVLIPHELNLELSNYLKLYQSNKSDIANKILNMSNNYYQNNALTKETYQDIIDFLNNN